MMTRAISKNIQRAIVSPAFLLSVTACFVLLIIDAGLLNDIQYLGTEDFPSSRTYIEAFHLAMGFGVFPLAISFFCVIPYTRSFSEEYNSRVTEYMVKRVGYRAYSLSKIASVSISGGLALVMGVLVASIVFYVFYGVPNASLGNLDETALKSIWRNAYLSWNSWPYMIMQFFQCFLFGAVWSCVGLAVSAFIPNQFVAVSSPFILYYTLNYITQMIGYASISPYHMFVTDFSTASQAAIYYLVQLALFFVCAFVFHFRTKRLVILQ